MRTVLARRRLAPAKHAGIPLGRLLLMLVLPLLLVAPAQGWAAELRLAGVTAPGPEPAPSYPVPNDAGMVLYLQRSTNPNTVVYAAQFGDDGMLKQESPIAPYWRRYNTDGDVKDLSMIEQRMAYGVTTSPREGGAFDVRFRAIPEIPLVLEQRGPGKAVLTVAPEGLAIDLTYGYLEVDEDGLLPSVTGIKLFGQRRADGRPVQVTYDVRGGEITSGAGR